LGTSFYFWKSEKSLDVLNARAMEALKQVGLEAYADEMAVNLPYGRKRALEIAATVAMNPELMLLDEPTQGMGHEDVSLVTDLIKRVSAGRTVLMVEHNMKVVANIATTISVLQRGEIIAEGSYEVVSQNPLVMEAYMGTADTELQGH
jgi:branched-chain amino acid transport system ATP-binding protein